MPKKLGMRIQRKTGRSGTRQKAAGQKMGSASLQPALNSLLRQAQSAPASISPADAATLQRSIGNRAMGSLQARPVATRDPLSPDLAQRSLGRLMVQRTPLLRQTSGGAQTEAHGELTLGPANDRYEQEADQTAAQIAGVSPNQRSIQRQEVVGAGGGQITPQLEGAIQAARSGGQPLERGVRRSMENSFGADFNGVKVHTDIQADSLNRSLQARAFTTGQDVFFRQGEYNPESSRGHELLAHELTHVVQQGGADARRKTHTNPDSPIERNRAQTNISRSTKEAVQRRIGFEIETGIPVMEEHPPNSGSYRGLDNDELEAAVPGGKLMVDHLPDHADDGVEQFDEWNILEFVTDPIADRMNDAAFRAQARQWIVNLQAIQGYAQGNFAKWEHVPNAGAAANPDIWIGLRPGRGGGFGFWDRVAPQATMGIKLSKIAEVFGQAKAGGHAGHVRHDRVSEGAHRGGPVANTIMTQLKANYPPTWLRNGGVKSLQGLLTLICNYILSGAATENKGGYVKNRSLFMYKSMLSTVRNTIIGEYYGGKILNRGGARRLDIKNRILAETHRGVNDEVFDGARYRVDPNDNTDPGTPVLTGDWLDEILTGTDDKIFKALKNPWSNEIAPEDVGGDKAAVMEMRDIAAFGIWGFNLKLSDTDDIVNYLASVYSLNKRWSRG